LSVCLGVEIVGKLVRDVDKRREGCSSSIAFEVRPRVGVFGSVGEGLEESDVLLVRYRLGLAVPLVYQSGIFYLISDED